MADSNPGNFANWDKSDLKKVAAKGGRTQNAGEAETGSGNQASSGLGSSGNSGTGKQGFASMDPDRQREIASMGGKASGGSFEKGSERAREAGAKGGASS
ncbi:unnamed protein product [Parascedosporium putredinis]|uniref:Conidiation-specific protein 10 n=1 Tax=Parascedosporium putredinis TaxID=1442378 RepID=A0A9P1GYK4_9PEZI|nr:unnamed protein product [Parascedosporium putredinis]CAI7991855.1 unnamed protein product [Parascedosporium putredinis]